MRRVGFSVGAGGCRQAAWTYKKITMNRTYASPGKCIYCGAEGVKLTDEHIIPLSLQGPFVFDDASCLECNAITHRFETTVINTLERFRARFGVKTRRPSKRKRAFLVDSIGPAGEPKKVSIPASEAPAAAIFYKFGPANILLGKPPFDPTFNWLPVAHADGNELNAAMAKYGWDGRFQWKMVPNEFARMLAKIGYSYAVAELGLGAFEPLCLDIILGNAQNYSYTVGGSFEVKKEPTTTSDHYIALGITNNPMLPQLVVVQIRLFQQMGSPHHHIVVGRLKTQSQIDGMAKYLSHQSAEVQPLLVVGPTPPGI
jgi:5-methylcytosine-specific restriction endonuclease McrA